jgi:hypothetical protein
MDHADMMIRRMTTLRAGHAMSLHILIGSKAMGSSWNNHSPKTKSFAAIIGFYFLLKDFPKTSTIPTE